jgi:hypothetical protein
LPAALLPTNYGGNWANGIVQQVLIGGTASVLGGGTFANGAVSAAFQYVYNFCTHNGCWTTRNERALLDKGDFLGYYTKACDGGDLNACFDYGVASGKNPGPTNTLSNALLSRGYNLEATSDLVSRVIPLNLALDYANLLPQSESLAAFPSAQAIADYHWNEFAKYGLPSSTFGGTPFGKSLVLTGLWCPLCSH